MPQLNKKRPSVFNRRARAEWKRDKVFDCRVEIIKTEVKFKQRVSDYTAEISDLESKIASADQADKGRLAAEKESKERMLESCRELYDNVSRMRLKLDEFYASVQTLLDMKLYKYVNKAVPLKMLPKMIFSDNLNDIYGVSELVLKVYEKLNNIVEMGEFVGAIDKAAFDRSKKIHMQRISEYNNR